MKLCRLNETNRIRGIPKIIKGEVLCYNSKLREWNYRQVEDNFIPRPKTKRIYIDNPECDVILDWVVCFKILKKLKKI